MLTAAGCRSRRQRFLDRLRPAGPVLLGDPLHLRYLANFHCEAQSLGADFGGLLLLTPDNHATIFHDNRVPKTAELAHADERKPIHWYDGQTPGVGPRRMVLRAVVEQNGGRIHDSLADAMCPTIFGITSEMRRSKDADEVELLKTCMRATDAGQAWARANLRPGMTELEVYAGISNAVYAALGRWAVVYGDFTVSTGAAKRGGIPTPHVLAAGETLILDFSVVVQGYRSDFTNTLVVGGNPTVEQQRIFDQCKRAIDAAAAVLRAGAACQAVFDAADAELGGKLVHHAGHGLGIQHPEAPFLVRHSSETLVAGDVVTIEPGLYVDGVGGVRLEHNYLVTATGFEQLSGHTLSLV